MILYTTMPKELIFPQEGQGVRNEEQWNLYGVPVLVERTENQYRIVKILSTDPQHFLDQRIVPGTTFQL